MPVARSRAAGSREVRVRKLFSNAVFIGTALAFAAAVLWSLSVHDIATFDSNRIGVFVVLPVGLSAAFLGGLKLPLDIRVNVALVTVSLAITIYLVEMFFALTGFAGLDKHAFQWGFPDTRTKFEVIMDLRKRGIDAYPTIYPNAFAGPLEIGGEKIHPLGGISDVATVLCNETGKWLVYRSDEHGFHNTPGIWKSAAPRVALLGDSFVHGSCVPSDRNIAATIRQRYPATLNLGMVANGPLAQLATLREYLPELKPRVTLWFYWEGNDLVDLGREARNPIFRKYLRPDFRQNLRRKQDAIDRYFRQRYRKPPNPKNQFRFVRKTTVTAADIVLLRNVRHSLQLNRVPVGHSLDYRYPRPPPIAYELLPEILAKAASTVRTWHGKLYFVYLVGWHVADKSAGENNPRNPDRQRVLRMVRKLGIPIIDTFGPFRAEPDPGTLLYGFQSHYSEKGYRVVAETVLSAIAKDMER